MRIVSRQQGSSSSVPDPLGSAKDRIVSEVLLRLSVRVNYERVYFRRHIGHFPNLRQPRSFNEKVSAMKLFADLPLGPVLCDKVAVRDYVANVNGERYLKEVIAIEDSADRIDFNALPESFALKTSHGSGMNVIVPDKASLDVDATRAQLARFLRTKFGRRTNEWWYQDVPPRILVERFLHDETFGIALDYYFFVFHGTVRFIRVVDRVANLARNYYDRDWNLMGFNHATVKAGASIEPPRLLPEMIELAEALAGDLEFVRVDLFAPNDERVLFGEMTLAPGAGWLRIEPSSGADYLGSFW